MMNVHVQERDMIATIQTEGSSPEMYEASAALAVPLLRALATPPLNDRIGALHFCADTEPAPARTFQMLIHCELSFHTAVSAIFDNQALIFLSELLRDRLEGSLTGSKFPGDSGAPDAYPYPTLREIVDLVSEGCGDEAVKLAHRRTDRIYRALIRAVGEDTKASSR